MPEKRKSSGELFAEQSKQVAFARIVQEARRADKLIRDDLEGFTKNREEKRFFRDFTWIHTNDANLWENFQKAMELVDKRRNSKRAKDHLQAAFVVGTSGLLSLLPALVGKVDCVIIGDNNLFVFEWMKKIETALNTRASIDTYMDTVYTAKNPLYIEAYNRYPNGPVKREIPLSERPYLNLEDEMYFLGEHHFLSSPENYMKSRQAIRQIPIIHYPINLLDKDDTSLLTEDFLQPDENTSVDIPFANLTNLWTKIGSRVVNPLRLLPLDNSIIIYAREDGTQEPAVGFEEYTHREHTTNRM